MISSSRRKFLQTSALLAAGTLLSSRLVRAAANTRVSDIGIQLYTVRKEMLTDPAGTLKQLAAIGFKELESARSEKGNYYGLGAKEIKKITEDLGMKLRSGHIHVDKDWKQSLEQATETGQGYIISAVLPYRESGYKRSASACEAGRDEAFLSRTGRVCPFGF